MGSSLGHYNLGIDEYNRVGLPIVSFDRKLSEQIPIVSCDNYAGGKLAVQELYNAGARHIYFLGNPHQQGNPTDQRLAGYCDTLETYGLSRHIHTVSFSESPSLKLFSIKRLLQESVADGIA